MITIISARIAPGYSGEDHRITGDECAAVIGQEYRTVRAAQDAAYEAAKVAGEIRAPEVEIEVEFASGVRRYFGGQH